MAREDSGDASPMVAPSDLPSARPPPAANNNNNNNNKNTNKLASAKKSSRIAVDYDDTLDARPWREVAEEYGYAIRSTVLQTEVYLRLSANDAGKRKGSYCLGFCSIMLVVVLCSLLLTTLSHIQIIFLRLAESESGRIDLLVEPGGQFSLANSLNYSVFTSLFAAGATSYHAARIVMPSMNAFQWGSGVGCDQYAANISSLWYPSAASTGAPLNVQRCSDSSCPSAYCSGAATRAVTLVFLDKDREARMGLTSGEWPYDPQLGEVVIPRTVANDLQLSVGSTILIAGDISYPLMEAYNTANLDDLGVAAGSSKLPYTTYGLGVFNLTVAFISDSDDEKFEPAITNVVVGRYSDALLTAARALSPTVPDAQRAQFAAVPPPTCASKVYINLPPGERDDVYTMRDYESIQTSVMQFSSQIFGVIGFNQVDIETPILEYLNSVRFFSLFLGLIVSLILVALAFLSIVLIYSLLSVNVQTRTFEMGLQRMLGFTKQNLTGLVFTNAMLFAIPAWAIGLLVGLGCYLLLRSSLADILDVDLPSGLSPSAIGLATLAGIGIPLFASIAPVMDVLTLSLPEALNSDRSRITAVIYKIRGRQTGYFSITIFLLGVAFTAYGFLIYYLFPLAIIDFNISLLFYIFFGILIAMLGGLVLLSINFERVVETAVSYIMLFWEQTAVFHLVSKNLTAHRPRNRKTTLMYALALGFILFITVAFNIQINSIEYSSLMSLGGDARYRGSMQWEEFLVFDELLHRGRLSSRVSRVTYLCDSVKDIMSITNISISSIGQYREKKMSLIAIPPSFYTTVDDSFLIVGAASSSPYSLSEALYTVEGSSRVIISTTDKKSLNLQSANDPFLLVVGTVDPFTGINNTIHRIVASPSAWLDASPMVRMSSLPQATGMNVLMSLPSSVYRSKGAFRSIRDNRVDSFTMALPEANLANVTAELALVRLAYNSDVELSDIYTTKDTLSTATTIVNSFFIFTQVMAMVICFFALLSSMSTNVLEQSKEIGILRCIGMHKFPLYRLYTWEAFVLVLSASLMGMIVGTIVAYSMLLQNALFTQIPLKFEFPVTQLIVVLVTSLVSSIVASYGPIAYLLNLPSITHILRRVL